MKKFLIGFAAFALISSSASAGPVVIISQMTDGDLTGGLPKAIELTNIGDAPADLSNWGIARGGNGGAFGSVAQLSGMLASGDSFVISSEGTTFMDVVGVAPDLLSPNANNNGDDTIGLFTDPTGTPMLVDIYGVENVDGTGEPWEYLDSNAVRGDFGPNTTWTAGEWTITSLDTLDLAQHQAILGEAVPGTGLGNHTHTTVPVELSAFTLE